jgi:hypothetical protein
MWFPRLITYVAYIYAVLGLLFAVCFAAVGVGRLDPAARGAGLGFRLLIVPGAAAFWPLLLGRWLRGRRFPPIERNAHRVLAASSTYERAQR